MIFNFKRIIAAGLWKSIFSTKINSMKLTYEAFLKANNLKNTAQRRLLFDAAMNIRSHLTIDELLSKVQAKDRGIGYATVYRMLKLMVEAGVLTEHHFDSKARYEIKHDREHHDHLICTSCGKIVEFTNEKVEKLQDKVAQEHGFVLQSHKHELYGLCPTCAKKKF